MAEKDENLVTSGAKLREMREQGIVLVFPSGNHYRVRNPTLPGLLKRGSLPNVLLTFVLDAFYSGATQDKVDKFLSLAEREEGAMALIESFRVICEEMFMDPRIVASPQAEDEAAITDLPLADQIWAFQLTFLPAEELYPFRRQPSANVVSVPEPDQVPAKAE